MRKYEYETGRFISIDPLWAKYYGWSPYQYSMNSPVMLVDVGGYWTKWVHNEILEFSFGNFLSDTHIEILKQASIDVDKDQDNQFKNAMRNEGQTIEDAKNLSMEWVKNKQQDFIEQKDFDKAIYSLGQAMHTLMDATSPSHKGYQEWKEPNLKNGYGGAIKHLTNEAIISDKDLKLNSTILNEFFMDSMKMRMKFQEDNNDSKNRNRRYIIQHNI